MGQRECKNKVGSNPAKSKAKPDATIFKLFQTPISESKNAMGF